MAAGAGRLPLQQLDRGAGEAAARHRAKRGGELTPIRPHFRYLYPIDWPQLSAEIRFKRARGQCEHCGRPHGQIVKHLGDGRWWDEQRQVWRDGRGRLLPRLVVRDGLATHSTKVVLATAHRDHDPTHNRPRNLAALCQRCHMIHDRPEHRRRRWMTLQKRRAIGDLFLGFYEVANHIE